MTRKNNPRRLRNLKCRNSDQSAKDQGRRFMKPFGSIQELSTPESLRGSELLRILPSVLPVTPLHEASCGLHRFEPVVGTMSPLSRAILLTRQGISLVPYLRVCAEMHSHSGRATCSFHIAPACRHADGTISSPTICNSFGVWRVVSEDSDPEAIGLSC